MLFNSIEFFVFFIFVLLTVTLLKKHNYKHLFLLVASYYFYFFSSNFLIVLLIFTTLITYYCGEEIYITSDPRKKKRFLLLALITALGLLGFFKYFNFAIETVIQSANLININLSIRTLNIILPIGISFYTFQGLSYVIDIYHGKLEPARSIYKYALFVAFFPQLVAGPIVRASYFLPQLNNKVKIIPENLKFGLTLIGWGLLKKVVISDNVGPKVDAVFSHPESFGSLYIILATFLFGIQIYCDFSGYSDIAIGSGRIMGFHLPQNFNKPYLTKDISEFWRRWHISLSSFIKDYLYIPLGGNRKGRIRTYINLFIAMLVTGLWHGAAWNFVIWGGYHGVLLTLHKLSSRVNIKNHLLSHTHFGYLIKILITQYFVFLGWLIFRVENLEDLAYSVDKFIFIDFIHDLNPQPLHIITGILFLFTIFLLLKTRLPDWIVKFLNVDWISHISSLKLKYWIFYLIIVILFISFFSPSKSSEFIYFQF